ncbi:MAG: PucR family transcriptional regulator [Mycobacteriales bacterium]
MPILRAVVDVLGPALTAIGDLDVEVNEVVLVGPGDPLPAVPGGLLVVQDHSVLDAVDAAAVVVRGPAPALDIPVLVAPDDLPWHHLLQLLTQAVSASGSSGAMGDLFALANSIAAMVGGAVAIEDPSRRVLAYSSLPDQPIDPARQQGILGRQVPDLSGNDAIYREMQRATGVVRIPANGEVLPRLAVAVRAGAELLGSLWVVEATPLPAESEQALLDAGRLAALHLLRARAGGEVERRARGELLRGLLDGRSAPQIAATRLGLDAGTSVAVLGFSLPSAVAGDELDADAVADVVQLQCAAVRPRSSVLVQLGTVYALVPDLPRPALLSLARAVVDRARVPLAGAVGATVLLHEVTRSRADVDAVLRLQPPGSVAAVEDVLPQVVLLHLQAHLAGQPHLRLPAVDRMIEHDHEHQTPYVESVLAYLSANADVPAAADSVSVHPNTFRYRLRRVRELFDLDLEDPDVRLVVWMQLRTRR